MSALTSAMHQVSFIRLTLMLTAERLHLGFVIGLPEKQKRRQWRLTWLRMMSAYRLQHVCREHVQQHKDQQVHS